MRLRSLLGQRLPPLRASELIVRERVLKALPHVAEHSDHGVHFVTTQFTRSGSLGRCTDSPTRGGSMRVTPGAALMPAETGSKRHMWPLQLEAQKRLRLALSCDREILPVHAGVRLTPLPTSLSGCSA